MAERDVDINSLFDVGNESALAAYLHLLHPSDIAQVFNYVDEENWVRLTARLTPEILAEVIADLDENQRETLGEQLHVDRLINIVEELETDDAADVLADLPDEKSVAVLAAIEDQEEVRKLLSYPEDTAGGIMQTEVCRVLEGGVVTDAIEVVREMSEEVEEIFDVYVVDKVGRLVGAIALQDLVLHRDGEGIEKITQPIEIKVTPDMDQEVVAILFRKYDEPTMPVVDADGILLGRITFDDIHDVIEEEASEDIMAMAGASTEELVYGTNVMRIAMVRIPWLTSALIGALLSGYLLSLFDILPGNAIVLAAFVPVVMAMTGNLGSQTAMIVTRGFAIGKVDSDNLSRTFRRELLVGMVMGLSAGVMVALVAFLWRGDLRLSLTVGASLVTSMSAAAVVGVGAPALFKRMGIDPAIAAGPLVTTGSDIMAISIYLLFSLFALS
ncbi:magnesium transporter [Myxococcota bacterium]|nr:magnesium transporter [Myxococcota bacterium]